jgi:hypothetical protein
MTENSFCTKTEFKCNTCNKTFATNGGIWKHNKKYHNDIKINKVKKQHFCKKCKIELMSRTTKWRHEKTCNITNPSDELAKKVEQMEQTIKSLQSTINSKTSNLITEPSTDSEEIPNDNHFVFNNLKIYPNQQTGYIDITPISTIPDKLFADWVRQDTTLKLISDISIQTKIPVSQLICTENNHIQLHPDIAVELVKWLSPVNGIKFIQWVSQLGTPSMCITKSEQIKSIPANTIPDNVVYIITSPVHRKLRTYIIGKAQNMKARLSNYNKSMEHEIVYYVSCHTGKIAQLVESMVLTRLHKFREVVNRDRFILPENVSLNLFTDVFDQAVGFFCPLFEL